MILRFGGSFLERRLILGSTTIVSTRNIGVVTTFGRPSGALSNGLHVKAPWQSVTEMNRTNRPPPDKLFLDYRDFENVRDNPVTGELRAALNEVFADFDPLDPENSDGANVQALGDHVAEKLRNKVGRQIEIINVIVPRSITTRPPRTGSTR